MLTVISKTNFSEVNIIHHQLSFGGVERRAFRGSIIGLTGSRGANFGRTETSWTIGGSDRAPVRGSNPRSSLPLTLIARTDLLASSILHPSFEDPWAGYAQGEG